MCILVIDLSYQNGTVFTMTADGLVIKSIQSPEYRSLSTLIQELTDSAPHSLLAIALPKGPGAFTPLRITAAAALAHALAKKIPLIPYSPFLGLVPLEDGQGKLFLDARSKSAYTTFYKKKGSKVEFDRIVLEPADVEPVYETNTEKLAIHIKSLFENGEFCPPLELKLEYIKQPR
jgi:tRNA A37 threonylcarbamoyladenosine modification protein TsaB